MRRFLGPLLALLIVASMLALAVTNQPQASGLTTNSDDQPGQVQVRDDDGVLYLDTQTIPGGSSAAGSTTTDELFFFSDDLALPEIFFTDFGLLLNQGLRLVAAISALLVFVYLIWGAFDWITSGGDRSKTDAARNKMTAAVVGLIIVAASYAVLTIVLQFLGAQSLDQVLNEARGVQVISVDEEELEASQSGEASDSAVVDSDQADAASEDAVE